MPNPGSCWGRGEGHCSTVVKWLLMVSTDCCWWPFCKHCCMKRQCCSLTIGALSPHLNLYDRSGEWNMRRKSDCLGGKRGGMGCISVAMTCTDILFFPPFSLPYLLQNCASKEAGTVPRLGKHKLFLRLQKF